MRQELEFFDGVELRLVYMARRLRDALKVEKVFEEAQIEYFVETGTYRGGFLFPRELAGAFFYVLPEAVAPAHEILTQNRYKPYSESD